MIILLLYLSQYIWTLVLLYIIIFNEKQIL